jgi:hypothetical protein
MGLYDTNYDTIGVQRKKRVQPAPVAPVAAPVAPTPSIAQPPGGAIGSFFGDAAASVGRGLAQQGQAIGGVANAINRGDPVQTAVTSIGDFFRNSAAAARTSDNGSEAAPVAAVAPDADPGAFAPKRPAAQPVAALDPESQRLLQAAEINRRTPSPVSPSPVGPRNVALPARNPPQQIAATPVIAPAAPVAPDPDQAAFDAGNLVAYGGNPISSAFRREVPGQQVPAFPQAIAAPSPAAGPKQSGVEIIRGPENGIGMIQRTFAQPGGAEERALTDAELAIPGMQAIAARGSGKEEADQIQKHFQDQNANARNELNAVSANEIAQINERGANARNSASVGSAAQIAAANNATHVDIAKLNAEMGKFSPIKVKDEMGGEKVVGFANLKSGNMVDLSGNPVAAQEPAAAPQAAIDFLKKNPASAAAFKAKYGYLPK